MQRKLRTLSFALFICAGLVHASACTSPLRAAPGSGALFEDADDYIGSVQGLPEGGPELRPERAGAEACGIDGPQHERGGVGFTLLSLDETEAEVVFVSDRRVDLRVSAGDEELAFEWPTDTAAANFQIGQPVSLTRRTSWESDSGTFRELHQLTNAAVRFVFASAHRVRRGPIDDAPLRVSTPVGGLTLGPTECATGTVAGCLFDRGERTALSLPEGVLVSTDAPLSRGEVLIDWARGARQSSGSVCGVSGPMTVEERAEVAYVLPAPAPAAAPAPLGGPEFDVNLAAHALSGLN